MLNDAKLLYLKLFKLHHNNICIHLKKKHGKSCQPPDTMF